MSNILQNLDKWKSSRRKRNEEALVRAIEIKKNEQEDELIRMRRKSKTFSEIQEDKWVLELKTCVYIYTGLMNFSFNVNGVRATQLGWTPLVFNP